MELPLEYLGQGEDHIMSFDVQDTVDFFVEDVSTAATTTQQNGNFICSCSPESLLTSS